MTEDPLPEGRYTPGALVPAGRQLSERDLARLQSPAASGVLERYLGGFESDSSHITMARAAKVVARDLFGFEGDDPREAPWAALATEDAIGALLGYRVHLAQQIEERYRTRDEEQPRGLATSTANQRIALLRGLVRSLGVAGLLDASEVTRLLDRREGLKTLKRITGAGRGGGLKQPTTPLVEQALLVEAAQAQFTVTTDNDGAAQVSGKPKTAARDAALLALLSAGLRRAEAATANWSDYGFDADANRMTLEVRGKGAKAEKLPVALAPGIVEALAHWRKLCDNPATGPILRRTSPRGDNIQAEAMTPDGIYRRLRFLMRAAGVEEKGAHSLRRAFVTGLLRAGVDAGIVSKLARHSDVKTTLGYDRRSDAEMLDQGATKAGDPFRSSPAA